MFTDHATLKAPLVLRMGPLSSRISGKEFFDFCQLNPDWRIERKASGDLIIGSLNGGEASRCNALFYLAIGNWNDVAGLGDLFDASTGFELPNGAVRSADCSWLTRDRWQSLSQSQRERFPPLAPDFVLELRSPSDSLTDLQAKMREYIECGVRLGWLIDPLTRRVWIYQPNSSAIQLENPIIIDGGDVLPGFVLNLNKIWP